MFRPILWMFALLTLSLSSTKAQPLPARAPIRGIVVDEAGQPLAGVSLSIRRQSEAGSFGFWGGDAQSDARGAFVFPDAEEGNYSLGAELQGFAPAPTTPLKWTTQSQPLRVPLQRLIRTRFTVRSSEGTPLSNADVWITLRAQDETTRGTMGRLIEAGERSRGARPLRTDEKGTVSVGEVAPGSYTIWARTQTEWALIPPQTLSSTSAEKIEISLQRGGALRARAQDSSNRALGGATLTSLTPDSPQTRALWNNASGTDIAAFLATGRRITVTSRDGDGLLEVPLVPPGRYLASFAARLGVLEPMRSVEVVADQGELQIWTLAAAAGATLTLDVRTKNDGAVSGEVAFRMLTISAKGALGGGSELFTALGPPIRFGVPDAQSRVELFPVKPARYRIWASRRVKLGENAARESSPVDVDVTNAGATATVVLP